MEKERPRGGNRKTVSASAKSASLPRGALQHYGQTGGGGGGGGAGFLSRVKRFLRIGSAGRYDLTSAHTDSLAQGPTAVVRSASDRGGESPLMIESPRNPPDRTPSARSVRRRQQQDKEEVVLIHSDKLSGPKPLMRESLLPTAASRLTQSESDALPRSNGAMASSSIPSTSTAAAAAASVGQEGQRSEHLGSISEARESVGSTKSGGENSGGQDDNVFEELDPGYESLEEIRRKLQLERERNKKKAKAEADALNGRSVSEGGAEVPKDGPEKRDRSIDYIVRDPAGMTSEESSRDSGLGSPHTDSPDSLRDNHVRSMTSSEFSESTVLNHNELAEGLAFPSLSCFPQGSDPDLNIGNLSPGACYRHDCGIVFSDIAPPSLLKDTDKDLYDNPQILFRKQSRKQCASETMMASCGLDKGKLSANQPQSSSLSLPGSAVNGNKKLGEDHDTSAPPPLPARKYAESEACGTGNISTGEEEGSGEEQACSDNSTLAHTEGSNCLSDSEAASTSCDHTLGSPDDGSGFPSPVSENGFEEMGKQDEATAVETQDSTHKVTIRRPPEESLSSADGKRDSGLSLRPSMKLEMGPICFIGGNKRNSDDVASNMIEIDHMVGELSRLAAGLTLPSEAAGAQSSSDAKSDYAQKGAKSTSSSVSKMEAVCDSFSSLHGGSPCGGSPRGSLELTRRTSGAKSKAPSAEKKTSKYSGTVEGASGRRAATHSEMKSLSLENSPVVTPRSAAALSRSVERLPQPLPPTRQPPQLKDSKHRQNYEHHLQPVPGPANPSQGQMLPNLEDVPPALTPKTRRAARYSAPCHSQDLESQLASDTGYPYPDPNNEPIHMSVAEIRQQMANQRLSFPGPQGHRNYAHAHQMGEDGVLEAPAVARREMPREDRRQAGNAVESKQNQDFLESIRQLKDCGWYWGPLSYDEAEAMLEHKPEGSFLVRDSSNENYILSISFKSGGQVHHTRIEHQGGMFSFWSQPESHGRNTIREFIEQTVENSKNGRFLYFLRPTGPGSPPLPIRLLFPVSRFCLRVASLQHICRFLIIRIVRRDHIDLLPVPEKVKDYLREKQYYVETLEES